ncbi:hypothetical protein LEP1GSC125_1018 [Leptospira mayottensis 200901122]|uniref:Uncharacterized protein n=1 Tax=Leptospira mayottensis 200901122 TaxID=1193010 RepID=A0AA87SVN1_9LEPT|nr:hypothetical protein LEP1GSC125_1018 [Leptospira mayottensis 200901122]
MELFSHFFDSDYPNQLESNNLWLKSKCKKNILKKNVK